ncbi:GNAT family N-acetyltransferase [Heyndrickxia sp. MSNUG]|uniref:GNAT family N-acetyltransferase n=1 Tax=Heyndrickxia sp. MSNUG TaxID=3136677 RepID=UPI003C2E4325
MTPNKKLFWSEMFYQPQLTCILPNLNPTFFDFLADRFANILGYPVKTHINNSDKERWTVSFHGNGFESSLDLILYLFDPSVVTCGSALIDIEKPTIEIVNFIINPKGKGLGSKVIKELIAFIESKNWGFEILMLKAKDRRAAQFWTKVGFTKVSHSLPHTPSMTRPLIIKKKKEKGVTVKINQKTL